MNNTTRLQRFLLNPALLNGMRQNPDLVSIPSYISFGVNRSGKDFHITVYAGTDGLVIISDKNLNTILRDYCTTPEQFFQMIEVLDDIAKRLP